MIDALNDDIEVVRKRKYRREDSMITTRWFDYNGDEITEPVEKARVEALATTHAQVDEGFEENSNFLHAVNKVNSVVGIPMDAHTIEVLWTPNGTAETLSMAHAKGLDGDSYKILVSNSGDHPATLYLPKVDDAPRTRAVEGEVENVGSSFIMLYPKQVALIDAYYGEGKWSFNMVRATAKDMYGQGFVDADFLICRFNWNREAGEGLDTALEAINTGIDALTDVAVGYGMNGNIAKVNKYLEWGGENTGSGKENFVVKLAAIRADMPEDAGEDPRIYAYASWFTSVGSGKATMEMFAYKGGTLSKDGTVFKVNGGELIWAGETDLIVKSLKGSEDFQANYTPIFLANINSDDTDTVVSTGDTAIQKILLLDALVEINNINSTIQDIQSQIQTINNSLTQNGTDIEQALAVTLTAKPTSTTVSYKKGEETVNFKVGAFVRVADADSGSFEFYKLANLSGNTATWVKMYDTKYGNVSLETTYNKGYEILNVTGGSRVTGVSSDLDYVKVVNSSSANITVAMNQSVASGVRKFTSPFETGDLVLTPGASATFVKKDASSYILTDLFGITMFPDLADANREGEWAMTVSPTGKPQLMEIADIRKWDESIVARMSIDGLNEKFPDAPLGFAVVCKTIGKIYEKVNGYNEWVETDIANTPSTDADI